MAETPGKGEAPDGVRDRQGSQRFHAMAESARALHRALTDLPRPPPGARWRPDLGEVIVYAVGYGIIAMVLAMRLLGHIPDR